MKKTIVITVLLFSAFHVHAQSSVFPSPHDIISLVNSQRAANGLPALVEDSTLDQAAFLKAQSLVSQGALIHTQAVAGALWWPLAQVGYDYEQVGENLATNYSDASSLVSDWMNSPEHRVNILDTKAKDIGVAVVAGDYLGSPSDYIVEYTALLQLPMTVTVNQNPTIGISGVAGTAVSVQVSGVSSDDSAQINVLLQEIVSLLRQIIILKQAHL